MPNKTQTPGHFWCIHTHRRRQTCLPFANSFLIQKHFRHLNYHWTLKSSCTSRKRHFIFSCHDILWGILRIPNTPALASHTFLESPGVVVLSAAAMPGEVIASGFYSAWPKKCRWKTTSFLPHIPKTCAESRSDKICLWWSNTCAQGILKIKDVWCWKDGAFFNGQWLHLYGKSFPCWKPSK